MAQEKIIKKKRLLFLIENEKNEISGYYIDNKIYDDSKDIPISQYSFQFTLKSTDTSSPYPIKYENKRDENYTLYPNEEQCLMKLGTIELFKENNNGTK